MKQLAKVFNRRTMSIKKGTVDWVLPNQLVGIEIEAENLRHVQTWPDSSAISLHWLRTSDGSLQRGNEYVLRTAMSGSTLECAINSFFSTGSLVRDPAGSTHIHLNMMDEDDTVGNLRNLCVLMYVFEELLFAVGDPGRAACGYTNRLVTAPERILRTIFDPLLDELPQLLAHVFRSDGRDRYYGFNMQALGKHGTVEFRYFPTATSSEELIGWIQLLMSFKKAAVELGSVQAIENMLSSEASYLQFVNYHFSSWYELFIKTTPYRVAVTNLTTVMAGAAAISARLEANVNVSALKNHAVLSKFFHKKKSTKKEPLPPAVRPDYIHIVNGNDLLPQNVVGFDRTLKHVMLYETTFYIWNPETQWEFLDLDILIRNSSSKLNTYVASYITYDAELCRMITEAFNARLESFTPRQTGDMNAAIEIFRKRVALLEQNPVSPRAARDGSYRLQASALSLLHSPPEDLSSYSFDEDEEVEQAEVDEEEEEEEEHYEEDYPEPDDFDAEDIQETPSTGARVAGATPTLTSATTGINIQWFVDEENGTGGQL